MREIELLRYRLDRLIEIHTLPEVLDTISDAIKARSTNDVRCTEEWRQLVIHLEEATEISVVLANLKYERGESLWSS